jgi:hypothetical protein
MLRVDFSILHYPDEILETDHKMYKERFLKETLDILSG